MKRTILTVCLLFAIVMNSTRLFAQNEKADYGIFNSLAVGLSASTTGIGVDVASPIGNYLALRAGISFMPNFTFSTDVDVDIDTNGYGNIPANMEVEGGIGRTSGELLLNVYPFKTANFFVCGGAYFGGGKIIKIKGHSDEL